MKTRDLLFTNHRGYGDDRNELPFFCYQGANLLKKLVFAEFEHPDVRYDQIGHTMVYCIQSLACSSRQNRVSSHSS